MKKTLLALLVGSLVAGSAQAQLFRPSVLEGAILGGAAGAVIGHNSGRHGGEGAAIGAVAGALIGAAIDNSRTTQPVVVAAPAPQVVYVQPAPVHVVPAYPRTVVVHRPASVVVYSSPVQVRVPAQRVVYVDPWGRPVTRAPQYGHGRWR